MADEIGKMHFEVSGAGHRTRPFLVLLVAGNKYSTTLTALYDGAC
jgi:hypothetical protein